MNYKIIAADLDGTLLNTKQELSAENRAAIAKLKDLGVYFAPCTGRTYVQIPEVVKFNEDTRYIIYSNGSVIFDKQTGEYHKECLSAELAQRVFEIFSEYDVNMVIHRDGRAFIDREKFTAEKFLYYQADRYFFELISTGTVGIDAIGTEAIGRNDVEMFCTMFHDDTEMRECLMRLTKIEGIRAAASTDHNIEIFAAKAGKGNAILRLADMLGIDRGATIAVGDSKNDLTMIEKAGLGLAMKNSMQVLIDAADAVICSNEEHCVKYILNNFILTA